MEETGKKRLTIHFNNMVGMFGTHFTSKWKFKLLCVNCHVVIFDIPYFNRSFFTRSTEASLTVMTVILRAPHTEAAMRNADLVTDCTDLHDLGTYSFGFSDVFPISMLLIVAVLFNVGFVSDSCGLCGGF